MQTVLIARASIQRRQKMKMAAHGLPENRYDQPEDPPLGKAVRCALCLIREVIQHDQKSDKATKKEDGSRSLGNVTKHVHKVSFKMSGSSEEGYGDSKEGVLQM